MDTIKINKKNVLMIAHRGVSGLETENNKEYTEEFFKKIGMNREEYTELIDSLTPQYDIAIDENTLKEILPRWNDNSSVKNTYGQMMLSDIETILRKKFCR